MFNEFTRKSCSLKQNVERKIWYTGLDHRWQTIWRMRFAYCIHKCTETYADCAVLVFLQQLCLHERASMLRYTCISLFRCSTDELNYTVRRISGGTLCSWSQWAVGLDAKWHDAGACRPRQPPLDQLTQFALRLTAYPWTLASVRRRCPWGIKLHSAWLL